MTDPPSPSDTDGDQSMQSRSIVRTWLAGADPAIVRSAEALGRVAIEAAAGAVGRLARAGVALNAGHDLLAGTHTLAHADPGRSWWPFAQRPATRCLDDIDALIGRIADEQDRIERSLVTARRDRAGLADADHALDAVIGLVGAVGDLLAAASRELARETPARAAFLDGPVQAALVERARDLLAQRAVTGQAVATIDLAIANAETLVQALDQARRLTLPALRTARSARHAVADAARGAHGGHDRT